MRARQFAFNATLVSLGTAQFGAISVQLNQLSQVSTFSALFDKYKIEYIECTFRPRAPFNSMENAATALPVIPMIYTVIDPDDALAPTTLAQLQEYQSCESQPSSNPEFTRRFRPHILEGAWDGTNVVPAKSSPAGWVDIAYTTIRHYGMKYGCTAAQAAPSQIWDIDCYVGVSFMNVR